MAHTPGPWEVQNTAGHDIHGQTAVYDTVSGEDIAIVYEGVTNATLIAAAPDLLATLRFIAEQLEVLSEVPRGLIVVAADAIAKAEGTPEHFYDRYIKTKGG